MEKKLHLEYSSKTSILLLVLVLSISFALLLSSLKNIIFVAGADEGYYLKYATYIGKNGINRFPDLFKDYIANQQHWVFPNPLRIGFIILSSIWLKIFGYSLLNLAYLSLFSYCLFLCISFYFVKKYFGEKISILFIILLTFSPLNMAMARRALMDATANLFMVTSIWLFFETIREKRIFRIFLFILIYSLAILMRENSILLSLFFMFYILLYKNIFKKPVRLIDFLAVTVFPFAIVSLIYLALAGSISRVIDTVRIILASPQFNQYAILFGSGPWFRYLIDFMLLSPWVCILAIAFSLNYITKNKWQESEFYLLLLSVSLIFLLSFFTKNVRYLFILDMPMRLFAILMLNELVGRIFKNRVFFVLIILVTLISFLDFSKFLNLFIEQDIYDPVSIWLLKASRIIPWR